MSTCDENSATWRARRHLATACCSLSILMLTGCFASNPPRVEIVQCPIPASLEVREVPAWTGGTYADLAEHALRMEESARSSELDKAAARAALGAR